MRKLQSSMLALGICFAGLQSWAQNNSFLTNGLIAFYPFNGNANDASGNGNDGEIFGPILTTDRYGAANSAYIFNGTSDYLRVTNTIAPVGSNEFTFSTWLFLSADSFNVEHRFLATADGMEQWQVFLSSTPAIQSFEFYTGAVRVGGAFSNYPTNPQPSHRI